MFSQDLERLLGRHQAVSRLIWGVVSAFVAVYGVLTFMRLRVVDGSDGVQSSPFLWPLVGLAIVQTSASLGYRRWQRSDAQVCASLDPDPERRARRLVPNSSLPGDRIRIEKLSPMELRIWFGLMAQHTTRIIALALHGGVTTIGMMLAVLERNALLVVPFALAATALNVSIYPNIVQDAAALRSRLRRS